MQQIVSDLQILERDTTLQVVATIHTKPVADQEEMPMKAEGRTMAEVQHTIRIPKSIKKNSQMVRNLQRVIQPQQTKKPPMIITKVQELAGKVVTILKCTVEAVVETATKETVVGIMAATVTGRATGKEALAVATVIDIKVVVEAEEVTVEETAVVVEVMVVAAEVASAKVHA